MRLVAWLFAGLGWSLSSCALPQAPPRIVLVGDVMLGRGVARAHADDDWDSALAALRPLASRADLAAANLESPLTLQPLLEPGGFDLRAPLDSTRALSRAGFSLVTLANNHSLDAGPSGLGQTLAALQEAGIHTAGPGPSALILSVRDVRLAVVAFDDVTQPLDLETAERVISGARASVQAVIVSIHWGSEYVHVPDARQRQVAQALANAGASVIWGHHPHVTQPVEWLQGSALPYPTLVAFSLGNTMFDQAGPPDTRRSAALWLELNDRGPMAVQAFGFSIDPGTLAIEPAGKEARRELEQALGPGIATVLPAPGY